MLKITDDNYEHYKKTFETIWVFEATRLLSIDPDVDYSPVKVLTKWENKSKSLAKKGLKEALRDTLTMILDLPPKLKKDLNAELIEKNLPTLTALTAIIRDTPKRVLKNGRIKNIDEYYIIKEFLVDTSSNLSTAERSRLETIFAEFESNYHDKKNAS